MKWITRVSVYLGIAGLIVWDHFAMGLTLEQAAKIHVGGFVLATLAIEFAFAYVFRLRKRSAYPNALLLHLAGINATESVARTGLQTILQFLRADYGFFIEAGGEDEDRRVIASSQRLPGDAQGVLDLLKTSGYRPGYASGVYMFQAVGKQVVAVPVNSLGRELGTLLLVGGRKADLHDETLLQNLGTALAMPLDNLMQRLAVQASESRFRQLLENASDFIVVVDSFGTILYGSPSVEKVLGYRVDEVAGRTIFDFFHPEDLQRLVESFGTRLEARGAGVPIELRVRHADGEWRTIEAVGNFDAMDDPAIGGAIFNARDITERKESEAQFRNVFESAGDVIYTITLDGTLTSLNPAFEEFTGWRSEEWVGKHFAPLLHPDDLPEAAGALQSLINGVEEAQPVTYEWRVLRRDGTYLTAEFVPRALVHSGKIVGVLGMVRDITQRRAAEAEIRHMAHHDPLTGLRNRAALQEVLEARVQEAGASHTGLALMFVDLDRFKGVNDTFGHSVGDELLKDVAADLTAIVREDDVVARVGGDEFVVVLSDVEMGQLAVIAERMLSTLERPRQLGAEEVRVTASIGIAVYPVHGDCPDDLLRHGDAAMYDAKERGRDNFVLYTPAASGQGSGDLRLESELLRALEHDEFIVHYQTIVDVATGRIAGAEALVRWQHPARGLLGPDSFIPAAEQTGLIVPLGEWVLRRACEDLRSWGPAAGSLRVAVNLSSRQLGARLTGYVGDVLRETGIDPQRLELEITEQNLMRNLQAVSDALRQLKELGVSISLDDFGTGYSSLMHLKSLAVDTIKIDRSFISGMDDDSHDRAIVSTVIGMGRRLKMRVIAEGVESAGELDYLRRRRCHEYQGFLHSRPVDSATFAARLELESDSERQAAAAAS